MDKLERQYNACINISTLFEQRLGTNAENFFAELFFTKVLSQAYKKDAFVDFFEDNWHERKYSKQSGKLMDKVFKLALQLERQNRGICDDSALRNKLSPSFGLKNNEALPFLQNSPTVASSHAISLIQEEEKEELQTMNGQACQKDAAVEASAAVEDEEVSALKLEVEVDEIIAAVEEEPALIAEEELEAVTATQDEEKEEEAEVEEIDTAVITDSIEKLIQEQTEVTYQTLERHEKM